MSRRFWRYLVPLVVVAVPALLPTGSTAKPAAKKGMTVKCTGQFATLSSPGSKTLDQFGLVTCGKPFGKGAQYSTAKETPGAGGTLKATGTNKAWFDLGSLHGPSTLSAKLDRHDRDRYRHGQDRRWDGRV